MRKRLSGILVVVACTTALTGCAFIHYTGPCFGVGCPVGTPGESSQYKPGEGPKTAAPQANAQAQPQQQPQPQTQASAKSPSDPNKNPSSSGSLFSRLKAKF
jgi:hypothetical protein